MRYGVKVHHRDEMTYEIITHDSQVDRKYQNRLKVFRTYSRYISDMHQYINYMYEGANVGGA